MRRGPFSLPGHLRLFAIGALLFTGRAAGQERPAPLDGPDRPFRDSLFDRLTGDWTMKGRVRGNSVEYRATAAWVLNHQFLRLDLVDVATPPRYQATVYIGYDNTSERYVAHWLDAFGGRASETLGYGTREGAAVRFVFEYPDGPFRTTFRLGPEGAWSLVVRNKNPAGQWVTFADYALQKAGR